MTIGHNLAPARLKSFIERVERLEEEVKALNKDKSEVYSEAKGAGFDVKALKRCIQLRRMDPSDRSEMETLVDVYMRALDEIGTPVATRVRVHETPHDPETGEISELVPTGADGECSPIADRQQPIVEREVRDSADDKSTPAIPPGGERGASDHQSQNAAPSSQGAAKAAYWAVNSGNPSQLSDDLCPPIPEKFRRPV